MNATDTQLALDAVLTAARAAMPEAENFDRFVGDRSGVVAELATVRSELAKAHEAVASARAEVTSAQAALQRIKDETKWALVDLGRIRGELDDLVRQRARRG